MLCSKEAVIARSNLYSKIREFFQSKNVLEVQTPLLAPASVTDPYIDSFEVFGPKDSVKDSPLYLQTSPEFAMKRLLSTDIGSIFQICKSFRSEEVGRYHNREFSMLEWYRLGFNLEDLMFEVAELLLNIFGLDNKSIINISYRDLFIKYLNFDYNLIDIEFLKGLITKLYNNQFDSIICSSDFDKLYNKDDLLMILLSNHIEPNLEANKIIFIYNYPDTQSALAKIEEVNINNSIYKVAKRFEVYYKGIELANGFYELTDHKEQKARFEADLKKREQQGLPKVKIDNNLICALKQGLPDCSGVALGLDRLLMLQLGVDSLDKVLALR